jgi:polar amino acid transport system substrate-binding protein
MTTPRRAAILALTLLATALTGCGSGSDHAQRAALAALNVAVPPPAPSAPTKPVSCRNVTASLRPPAAMAAPGRMPAGSYMATIRRRGYLIAGVDQNTLLFAYFNPLDGHLEGFEIDLLRQLAQAIFGNPNAIRFEAITTAERVPFVQQGRVDVVADAMTITCQRRTEVDFSTVYYDASQRVLVPSQVSPAAGFAGQRICATTGSTSIVTLQQRFPRAIPYPVAQRTDCLVALQQGLVDAITSDDAILRGFQAQDPYTRIVGPSLAPEPYGMAISKAHPDFVRFVNGVLQRMRVDGRWHAIFARWLGRFSSTIPAPPAAQYEG